MFNIVNGGAHASDSIDLQEIMVVPAGAPSFREALRIGAEIYQALKLIISGRGLSTQVGDEGGFAPQLPSNRFALELVALAVERAGYVLGEDCYLALDAAATEFMEDGRYHLHLDDISLNAEGLTDFYRGWSREFHILSIEDGLGEDDWLGWRELCDDPGPLGTAGGRRSVHHQPEAHPQGYPDEDQQRRPVQAEPGWHRY